MSVSAPEASAAERPTAIYLTRNLAVGGAERVFLNYANNARRVRPVIALLERRGGLLPHVRGGIPCEARVDPRGMAGPSRAELPGETFARLWLECRWLRDVVRRHDGRIVSSFLMRAHIVALLTKVFFLPNVPVVLNIHEHMTESAEFLYPLRRDRALMRWVTRHLFPRANRIVVVADAVKRDLVASYGVPEAMVHVVHNPLDLERIRAGASEALGPRWSSSDDRQTIVAVGRLVALKGYDLLLRAVAAVRGRRNVRVIFVGDGDDRPRLEALATQLGIGDAVEFAGQHDNPWRFMALADVLALTSHTEAFPCVLAEAMAIGVPVLATNCSGGVRELLDDGTAGVLVPPGDVDAIAAGLDRLLTDADLRARLAAAGRARAESFDLPLVRDRYESLLTGEIAARTL